MATALRLLGALDLGFRPVPEGAEPPVGAEEMQYGRLAVRPGPPGGNSLGGGGGGAPVTQHFKTKSNPTGPTLIAG